MTHDCPEAQTWADVEEDCDAVNQAGASKINDCGYSVYQWVSGRSPPQLEDAILECGGVDLGVEATNMGIDAGKVDDHETYCPSGELGSGS